MTVFGDIRSNCQARSWADAYRASLDLEGHERDMVWSYIRASIGYDEDSIIDTIASECIWRSRGANRESLWCIDEHTWTLNWRGCVVASSETMDLQPLQHIWAIGPVWERLHLWEEWASDYLPSALEVPRKLLIAKWEWCHRETLTVTEDLRAAQGAARTAAWAAVNAVWGTESNVMWTLRAAENAAAGIAGVIPEKISKHITWSTGILGRSRYTEEDEIEAEREAEEAEFDRYCDMFTRYVLTHAVESQRS